MIEKNMSLFDQERMQTAMEPNVWTA